ncbi:MAG: sialate O-acetylesterase [Dinghuibacter sp.]|nr:sialate O-acetylesterase [Dinghuibacter sp.]
MNRKNLLSANLFCAACLLAVNVHAEIKLPAIFSNNMVLQQQTDAAIWGTAKELSTVKLVTSWNNKTYVTKAAADGRWKLKMATPQAGGPYTITISDGKALKLENILIGEVWVCSGQSNMEMPLKGYTNQPVIGSLEATVNAPALTLRLFSTAKATSVTPLEDCKGRWDVCNSETASEFSATAFFFGRMLNKILNVPIGLIHSSWGGTAIQPWMSEEACKEFDFIKDTATTKNPPKAPSVLFNAMINPFVGYGIRGAIWYQGESNRPEPENYELMLPGLIKDWRRKWQLGDFPFYYMQIAPVGKNDALPNSAFLREAQLKVSGIVPNVGMACIMDIGEQTNVHPAHKETGSNRLAYLALSQTYQVKGISCFSPRMKAVTIKNDTVKITFSDAPNGLTSFGKTLSAFELAGADKVFHTATAVITRDGVLVKSAQVPVPVAVRYAFKSFVVGDLFGVNGLPVSSFRSDNWEREK